ncbi:MAG: 4-(cytidine 5'-diphospho)-2-C-methyl-D-erythritol kinase, partial [Actinobacteria bacterium]|nr:4-(cytidine 5'-diphospho)-2-C-methyl-D-erythritol kinase [Actinomycetota bacterium]
MMICELAPAKINLTLEILNKRVDGYHEILSVMQTIDLCDILTFWSNDW